MDSEKFSEYYSIRDEKIKELDKATINFNFNFTITNDAQFLEISVKDSGIGFQKNDILASDEQLHGRGLDIIRSFCEEISFSEDGKTFTALYRI